MLAEVQPLPTDVFIPAPPSFTATFNPSPDPPTSNQFSLTADGPVANLILVEDGTTEITITLAGGLSFSSQPMVWSLPQDGFAQFPPMVSGPTNNILTFTVPAPTHTFFPWVFRLLVDVPGVTDSSSVTATSIRSQNIYIAIAPSSTFTLKFNPGNGNFSFVDSLNSPQDGAPLGNQLVMINTYYPTAPFIISVDLMSDPSIIPAPVFPSASQAMVWSSGEQPLWIPDVSVSATGSTLSFIIDPSLAMGRSIGLQFAIVVTNATTGESTTILSPDPILINSTIGDG